MTHERIVAIIAAYNEADIIGQVVEDFIRQGVAVWLIDHASTDGTVAAVEPWLGRGLLSIERYPSEGAAPDTYPWEALLRRKETLAAEIDADWFIHADADEFRESPWTGVPLGEAIRRVEALGYNAIDSARFDFWPIDDTFRAGDDVRETFRWYEPAPVTDRIQIRCWKAGGARVDLVSSGGHEACFPGRSVFPLRFIVRHYPIRGQAHGARKVFVERRPRFLAEERARGWHVQYDAFREGQSFLRDPATLAVWDPDGVRAGLMLRHRGIEALEADVTRVTGDLARADREREVLRARVEQLEHDATRAESHRVDAEQRLRAVHASHSWRVTAPLRALFRLLSGRP